MLYINKEPLGEMVAHAEHTREECCGFFFGYDMNGLRTITNILAVPNANKGNRRYNFEIAPRDYMLAEAYAERHDLQLLGVYHSHPEHSAYPSEYDRLLAAPYFSYIIISVINGQYNDVRSWRLSGENHFEEEKLNIIDSIHNLQIYGNRNYSNATTKVHR